MIVNSSLVNYTIVELTSKELKDLLDGKTIYQRNQEGDDSYQKSCLVCCYCSDTAQDD